MKEVKKIEKIPAANLLASIYAVVGFVFGVAFYLFFVVDAMIHDHVMGALSDFLVANLVFTIALGLGVAVVTGVLGWILGFLFSSLYNLFARKIGGARISLKDKN